MNDGWSVIVAEPLVSCLDALEAIKHTARVKDFHVSL
jgi:hypothetical protein